MGVDRSELAVLRDVLIEAGVDPGQERGVADVVVNQLSDCLIRDGRDSGDPKFWFSLRNAKTRTRVFDGDVGIRGCQSGPAEVEGINALTNLWFFVEVEDELRETRILRVVRSRLVCEWVARRRERRHDEDWED